jgi:rod shape-determining protein MreC
VATVATVERNAAYAFARIACTPTAGIDRHSQILILSSERKVEPPPEDDSAKDKPAKGRRPRPAAPVPAANVPSAPAAANPAPAAATK